MIDYHIIEYDDSDKIRWYLTIGRMAPWLCIHFRIPKKIALIIIKFKNRGFKINKEYIRDE
jgi:hypothetical protein